MINWHYLKIKRSRKTAVLGPLQNVAQDYLLEEGLPLAQDFPPDAAFSMHQDYGLVLEDVVSNISEVLVISDAAKAVIKGTGKTKALEFLPVRIFNHKNRKVTTPYFILNITSLVDALDAEASSAKTFAVAPEDISRVERLVLTPHLVDEARGIFRLKRYPYPVLFHPEVMQAIEDAGLKGFGFKPIEDFKHNDIL